jgi:hypothetical protein
MMCRLLDSEERDVKPYVLGHRETSSSLTLASWLLPPCKLTAYTPDRMRSGSGFLCVNDGPRLALALARLPRGLRRRARGAAEGYIDGYCDGAADSG